jgi:hypothetical protein
MRRPRTEWQKEVLKDTIITNLDSAIDSYDEEKLVRLAERLASDPNPGETPEFIAAEIGHWITEQSGPDFTTPVYEDTEGGEGERLALGYIGVKGLESADIGTVPEI